MAIDLETESTVNLARACREHIPRYTGKVISPQTAYRWIRPGILAADGVRVRLEAVKLCRDFVTTEAAIHRFFDELVRRSNVQPAADGAAEVRTAAELKATGLMTKTTEA